MLVAQALVEGITLLTVDRVLSKYPFGALAEAHRTECLYSYAPVVMTARKRALPLIMRS